MTALPGRRRRSTTIAFAVAIVGVVLAGCLGALGAVTLYNSTEGADASSGQPELVFPNTPTGLLAAVDGSGQLASLAVLVAQPSGSGGSVITVPVSADASAGSGADRLPIAETLSLSGAEALGPETEVLLGLTLDEVEVVDTARLTQLLGGLGGAFDVDLPIDVTDVAGDVVAERGEQTLDAGGAAAILTARDPSVPAAEQYRAADAVWAAISTAIGDGVETAPTTVPPSTSTADAPDTRDTLDGLIAPMATGPVGHRGLQVLPVAAGTNPRSVDVVLLDGVELALVFGQIAPGNVAAPNPALSVRISSAFTDEQLAPVGLTNADVAYAAISQILFVGGNVLSVDTGTTDAEAPGEDTVIEVADQTLVAGTEGAEALFGSIDVRVGESRIVGVDAIVTLGTDYLALLRDGAPPMPTALDEDSTDLAPGTTDAAVSVATSGPTDG